MSLSVVEQLNLNQLRVFGAVYRNQSMTLAAKELHLTQSGVSQHIRALEETLDKKLFDRIHQKLVPTSTANTLYDGCHRGMLELEKAFWKLSGKELSGTISFGAPPEFAYNVLMPMVSKLYSMHRGLTVRIDIGLASSMNDRLLKGFLDFAFVDDFTMDPRVKTEPIYDELIEMYISPKLQKRHGKPTHDKAFYEALPYVGYELGTPVLNQWFSHHLPKKKLKLDVRGYFSDAQYVGKMVLAGIGAGVLPSYVADELEKRRHQLVRIKGKGKPLYNSVSLAYVGERTHSLVAQTAMDFFRNELTLK